ncbi:MAG: hypothetical protein ACHQ52_00840 [Candidatus Eisenbacteria bacterium]
MMAPITPLSQPMTRIERFGLAVGLLLATALMLPIRGYLTDDTFIHLQYARHLAGGLGLVFNPGERVYGCTSPLWVTLLADGMLFGFDGLKVAKVVGFVSTLASVGLFLQLMRRTVNDAWLRAIATVAWAGHAWMIRWSVSGMETPLAVALTLGGFVAFTEGRMWGSRPVRTGALWSLAALTRPEAGMLLLLWGAFLLIDADTRDGLRRMLAGTVPPLLIYGCWLLFARFYFGTLWPQTLAAKTVGGAPLSLLVAGSQRELELVAATDGVLALLLVLTLVLGGRALWPSRPTAQRFLPWCWVIGVPTLYVARGVTVLSRYLLLVLPVLAWLAWRGLERWWLGDTPGPQRVRSARVAFALVGALVLAQNVAVYRAKVVPQVNSFTPALQGSLLRWGGWFRGHTPPEAVIAAPDIGAVGYASDRRIVDLAGLVTPEMVPFLMREPMEDAIAGFAFAAFSRPDYLMDRDPRPFGLLERSKYAACLTPIGHSTVPNLGIARPDPITYSVYRIDWAVFDSVRAVRMRTTEGGAR